MPMGDANRGIPRNQVVTGARAYVTFNGAMVAYVTNVSISENLEHQPLDCLDNLETEEHVAVALTVSGQLTLAKVVGRSLKADGVQITLADALSNGGAVMEVKDRPQDKALYTVEGLKVTGVNRSVAKRQLTNDSLQFVGKRVRDERGLV